GCDSILGGNSDLRELAKAGARLHQQAFLPEQVRLSRRMAALYRDALERERNGYQGIGDTRDCTDLLEPGRLLVLAGRVGSALRCGGLLAGSARSGAGPGEHLVRLGSR